MVQEYYFEESVVATYREAIQELHLALLPSENDTEERPSLSFTAQSGEDTEWPPWPWPPWGPGGDDSGPVNETERIFNLTSKFIDFETALANASLDPYEHYFLLGP